MARKLLKIAAVVLLLVAGGASAALGYTGWWRALFVPGVVAEFGPHLRPGAFAIRGDIELPVLVLEGTPEEMGKRHGEVLGPVIRGTISTYLGKLHGTPERLEKARATARTLEPEIPEHHRAELRALAAAAGVAYDDLVLANCSADLCVSLACSTLVATGEAAKDGKVVFGRNLDFPGYGILDGRSILMVYRPKGKKAFVAPSWPGLVGVQSGMNEKGLCIADMVDLESKPAKPGIPYSFLMRLTLEARGDVAGAVEAIGALPRTVSHNLMLADEKGACALEVGPAASTVRETTKDLVHATNNTGGSRDGCPRFKCLSGLAAESHGKIDAARMRELIASTSITFINLHAMVMVPADRTLQFARGTTLARATDGPWAEIDLGPVFEKGPKAEDIEVRTLAPVKPPRRYDAQ